MRVRHLFTLGWFAGWMTFTDFTDPADITSSIMWASFSLIVLLLFGKVYASAKSGQFEDDEENEQPIKATKEDFR